MDYSQTIHWLFNQLPMYQRVGGAAYKANLNNTHRLMETLDHPELKFKSIHVAGTNGKGSVSSMLSAIFQTAGFKTGLYTSPHLTDFRERIRIDGKMIPEQKVMKFVKAHKKEFKKLELSFFEMTVGMAFDYFAEEKVDIAIIEVGMGGRLDSTNVIKPELSIITNISFDHTAFLGNDLASIAREKAGIIKENTPVLIGERQNEIIDVFKEIATQKNADLFYSADVLPPGTANYLSDLKGSYQEKNIRTVLAAISLLDRNAFQLLPYCADALMNVKKLTGLRGRWEILRENPTTIADSAHNVAGISEVLEQLRKISYRQLHIVWGMVADKDIQGVLRILPTGAIYYFCQADIPRAMNAEELKRESVQYGLSGKSYSTVADAYRNALKNARGDDLIFVGGSTFIVADILKSEVI